MATITAAGTTITPLLILSSDRAREPRNVVIDPIDAPEPYVSLAESKTPTQDLRFLFADEPAAQAALDLVSLGRVLAITTDTRSFSCVKIGPARIDRTSENRNRWELTVEVREL